MKKVIKIMKQTNRKSTNAILPFALTNLVPTSALVASPTTVKLKYDILKMPIKKFLELPPSPVNRPTESRAQRPMVINSISTFKTEHYAVAIAELTKNCVGENGTFYKKGTQFIQNGNTRQYFWKNGLSDIVPKYVDATIYYCETLQQVADNYYTFDSTSAVEVAKDKVAGIILNTFGYSAKSKKIADGVLTSSLVLANHFFDANERHDDMIKSKMSANMIGNFLPEIIALDKIILHSRNWDQSLMCMAFMALRKHGTNNVKLLDALTKLDRMEKNTTDPKSNFDGITHISNEWTTNKIFPSKPPGWFAREGGLIETTSFALYWLEKYLAGKRGIKKGTGWQKTAEEYFV